MNRILRRPRTPLVVGAVALLAMAAGAALLLRRAGVGVADLDRPIDAGIDYTLDSLPNGVRYYVQARGSSGDRAELRLVVDAGSLQEDEDQRGLAHAVEHMVFRGTRRFPGGAVESWFDAIGMRRGDDVNATTSMDDTQFRMTVPSDRAGAIDSALAMLASMAHEATFDTADARREGSVLIEEWRSSRHVGTRLADALDFWSRRAANGDGFTVAIAGDFTLAQARDLVRRYLASIPRGVPEQPRARGLPVAARGVEREVPAGIVAKARTAIGFTGSFALSNEELNALGMVREVLSRALNERLRDEMGGTYGVDVSLEVDVVPPARYTMSIEFESDPGRMEALAAATFDELARLHREGPTAAQFRGAREAQVRDFDGRLEDNEYWAEELSFHARHGWPLEGIAAHGREAEAATEVDVRRACATYIPARDYVRVTMRPRSPLPSARHATRQRLR